MARHGGRWRRRSAPLAVILVALAVGVCQGARLSAGRRAQAATSAAETAGYRPSRAHRSLAAMAGVTAVLAGNSFLLSHEIFEDMDADRDGQVSKQEYMAYAVESLDGAEAHDRDFRRAKLESFVGLFDYCDVDRDEVLGPGEVEYNTHLMHKSMENLGRLDPLEKLKASADFREVDENSDGAISASELESSFLEKMKKFGIDPPASTADMLSRVSRLADLTADGALNVKELQFASFLLKEWLVWEVLAVVFFQLDTDHDRGLSKYEAEAFAASHRETSGIFSRIAPLVSMRLLEFDRDHDGALRDEEVLDLAVHIQDTVFSEW